MSRLYAEYVFPEDKTGIPYDFKEWSQAGIHK